jgi:hypothetical protein
MNTPPVRLPQPNFDREPTDEELGWDDDIPVNVDGEIDEEPE